MTIHLRVAGCAALALLFTRGLGSALEDHLNLGCEHDPRMLLCGLDVRAWVPQWHDPMAASPLLVWALAAALVTAVLMAIWRRAPMRSKPPPDGVALCSFSLVLSAVLGLISSLTLTNLMEVNLPGGPLDPFVGATRYLPVIVSLLIVIATFTAGIGLWAMLRWARALGTVLAVASALLTLSNILRFQLAMAEHQLDGGVPQLIISFLKLTHWTLVAGYLLRPSVGRRFATGR